MDGTRSLHTHLGEKVFRQLLGGTSVDLVGVHGSGRSVLLRDVAQRLEDSGVSVARAAGLSTLRDRPLEALLIADLVPRQPPVTTVSGAAQAVADSLRDRRSVLVVDDASDLDAVSSDTIAALHASTAVPVLSASTPGARASSHRWARGVQPCITVNVPSLGYVDTQTLLSSALGGSAAAETVSRIFSASGGLPGTALAIVRGARDLGTLAIGDDGLWTAGPDLWSDAVENAVLELLHDVSPAAIDGLHALSLSGAIAVHTARRIVSWDVLEELDDRRLLRFLPQGDEVIVSVFPLVVAESFERGTVGARHLRVDEVVTSALGGTDAARLSAGLPPWQHVAASLYAGQETEQRGSGTIFNRLLLEHYRRESLLRRAEWEQAPSPRTAVALLRTMLAVGAPADEVREMRDKTPRSGDRHELVAFDAWWCLYLGVAERDMDQVHEVLSSARAETDDWAPLIAAVEAYVTALADHAVDPDDVYCPTDAAREVAETVGMVRSELLLLRGRSADALSLLEDLDPVKSRLARAIAPARGYVRFLEGDLDGALSWAEEHLVTARHEYDVDEIVSSTYVAALVFLMMGRTSELYAHVGATLSTGLLSSVRRPQQVALMSIAASLAANDGRMGTARTLAEQALAMGVAPGPAVYGSPTRVLAMLDAEPLGHRRGASLVARRLWDRGTDAVARGYLVPGYLTCLLAMMEEPTAERAAVLRAVSSDVSAPLFRLFERAVDAMADEDPEDAVAAAEYIADAGMDGLSAELYNQAQRRLRAARRPDRAMSVALAAQRRLGAAASHLPERMIGASSLTAREEEVVGLAVAGLQNKDIAQRLFISVRTVENHLHRAFRKLGVDGRAEARAVIDMRRPRPIETAG